MTFYKRETRPRCRCGGVIAHATSRGFICDRCWRDDSLHAERVAEIVKRFDHAYGPQEGAIYAARLSDYFDAIEDAVQAMDYEAACVVLRARETE